jgi:glycosyltransferase involved in cell wall biosynthesis
MPLLKLNYENTSYPKDKIEMIVIDDGIDNILNALPEGENIKHFKYNKKECIGRKRNMCVEKATNDIIVFWDDDDYYPVNSLINRVGNLLKSNKDCVFCSSIGCFHIQKLSSIINVSPIQYPLEKKVSESTLTFKKSFWKDKEFKYTDRLNEGEYFIEGRVDKCKEISWEGVIVQLLHSYNTNSKNIKIDEKNGSHFGFSDEEFKLIKNL